MADGTVTAQLLPLNVVKAFIDSSIAVRTPGANDAYGIIASGGDFKVSDFVPEAEDDGTVDVINSVPFLLAMIQDLKCRVECLEACLAKGVTIVIPIPDPPPAD